MSEFLELELEPHEGRQYTVHHLEDLLLGIPPLVGDHLLDLLLQAQSEVLESELPPVHNSFFLVESFAMEDGQYCGHIQAGVEG